MMVPIATTLILPPKINNTINFIFVVVVVVVVVPRAQWLPSLMEGLKAHCLYRVNLKAIKYLRWVLLMHVVSAK